MAEAFIEEIHKATASLAAAKQTSLDAVGMTVLSQMDGTFTLKEQQRTGPTLLSVDKMVLLHS